MKNIFSDQYFFNLKLKDRWWEKEDWFIEHKKRAKAEAAIQNSKAKGVTINKNKPITQPRQTRKNWWDDRWWEDETSENKIKRSKCFKLCFEFLVTWRHKANSGRFK